MAKPISFGFPRSLVIKNKVDVILTLMLLASIELTLFVTLTVSIPNYDLLKYPLGLTQQLPFSYWMAEFLSIFTLVLCIINYNKMNIKIFNLITAIDYLLITFNSFFIFYFINPVFILSRDELGHAAEVFILLTNKNTFAVKGIYQSDYPLSYIYGAISYLLSGISPSFLFLYLSPIFFPIFQNLTVYAFIRLFVKSPMSEIGALIYTLSSMPFFVAEWSPQLMSYNLLFPMFLVIGMIIKRGGVQLIPLMILFSILTGLTDIGTFASSLVVISIMMVYLAKKWGINSRLIGYSAFATVSAYVYWVYFNPLASGAVSGDKFLITNFINFIKDIFFPQTSTNLALPTQNLVATFVPPSPYHFYGVLSKLLEGGIFLLFSIFSFILLRIRKQLNPDLRLIFLIGTGLLVMQSAIGIADNVSNVLTRMIPQTMVFYVIFILVYLLYVKLNKRKVVGFLFLASLILNAPLSILGYTTIATSEHSPQSAFYGGMVLAKYGLSTISTYDFYKELYIYQGNIIPPMSLSGGSLKFGGDYVETLSLYFNGPNLKGYYNYYNGLVANYTIIYSSNDVIIAIPGIS
ncbi:hypothetical protein MetMK1DRAFT_00000390 [Metallosphaera yellowstonensis MK1]|jgi:hypothetical protein|uniref:Uncharacterized protein n=1 Tax=Metallosphaera yellowstonensis MK1 TaxID=671065 RepID=H2C0G8_9CREN|nr:hypothetical protein [Metallosphaera yellowstonensis]EHP71230.1 hypothetical protein MetMK1DRAFT_00000390 [Metallosphaera yellowstonensis MK1]